MATKAKLKANMNRKKQRGVSIKFRDLMAYDDLIYSEISYPVRGLLNFKALTMYRTSSCISLDLIGINPLI